MADNPRDFRAESVKAAEELSAMLPTCVWVEGDGKMYGDFTGGGQPDKARHLSELDVVRLLHRASEKARSLALLTSLVERVSR